MNVANASPTPSPGRILVVDDNADAGEMLAEALSLYGYEAVSSLDPLEALELARREPPRAALLDIGLPGIDGYELARRMRAEPSLSKIPLIALTGYGQSSDIERSEAAGFSTHLVKPVQLEELMKVLESLLR